MKVRTRFLIAACLAVSLGVTALVYPARVDAQIQRIQSTVIGTVVRVVSSTTSRTYQFIESGGNLLLQTASGGAFSTVGTFTSGGGFTAAGNVVAGGAVQAAATDNFEWASRSRLKSTADGNARVTNNASTNTYDITLADWGTTLSAEGVSVANAGTVAFGTAPIGRMFIVLVEDMAICEVILRGTNATVATTDVDSRCSITKDTASRVNVYLEGGFVVVQNNRGATRTLRMTLIGV